MSVKDIMMLGVAAMMASCSTVRMTSDSVAVDAQVSTYPTIADLHISPQRVSKSVSWSWNPFNTTSLEARRGNIKAELIKETGADILIEPEFVQRTSWGNLLGGSLTVTGYPAVLDNFRKATPEDIEAMRGAGMLTCQDQYIVLGQDDINGMIVGKTDSSSSVSVVDNNVTSSMETADVIPSSSYGVVETPAVKTVSREEQKIPGDPVSLLGHSSSGRPSLTPSSGNRPTLAPSSSADLEPLAYDAIGKTRYLTTMSREYYGNPNFWPYIYEENKAKFGHPDRIKPGTPVIVPSLKKYGVNPKNPADIEKAKRLGKEIYARYGKYI
ncbi:MAG: hypothetical protein K2H22_07755 [Muribaculaceae bacterium]|nr:hypothetical protein [Muribaculaceae bacterium]